MITANHISLEAHRAMPFEATDFVFFKTVEGIGEISCKLSMLSWVPAHRIEWELNGKMISRGRLNHLLLEAGN